MRVVEIKSETPKSPETASKKLDSRGRVTEAPFSANSLVSFGARARERERERQQPERDLAPSYVPPSLIHRSSIIEVSLARSALSIFLCSLS